MQSSTTALTLKENIYTVSRLTSEVRALLEGTYLALWVEGEISNFSAPNSGHWYFSLKDANAQVRCAMFRGSQRKLGFIPKDGMHVLVKAKVSLYENRGDFQLIIEDMEERGEGQLRHAFEVLKKKLAALGLFDKKHKQALPEYPQQLGVVTSATGAAIRDILTVLKRRFPCLPIIIYPSLVQGASASLSIVNAIEIANRRQECDLLILARGGGSLEDLWPFNEENVAYAIHHSRIPIISGVGHEVDVTIADFVADVRAPTPSAAAEIATPDGSELSAHLIRHHQHLWRQLSQCFTQLKQQIVWMQKNLQQQHPKRQLLEKMQQLDFGELSLKQLQMDCINRYQTKLKDLANALQRHLPLYQIQSLSNEIQLGTQSLLNLITQSINAKKDALAQFAAKLDTLSPLATLKRGFAIATQDKHVLLNANQVKKGDTINVRLNKGTLGCTVNKVSQV